MGLFGFLVVPTNWLVVRLLIFKTRPLQLGVPFLIIRFFLFLFLLAYPCMRPRRTSPRSMMHVPHCPRLLLTWPTMLWSSVVGDVHSPPNLQTRLRLVGGTFWPMVSPRSNLKPETHPVADSANQQLEEIGVGNYTAVLISQQDGIYVRTRLSPLADSTQPHPGPVARHRSHPSQANYFVPQCELRLSHPNRRPRVLF